MKNILAFIKKPFAAKGVFIGACDWVLRLAVAAGWLYVVYLLGGLLYESLLIDYNVFTKLWWCSYCFFMFFGATWFAYIIWFVRDYNEE